MKAIITNPLSKSALQAGRTEGSFRVLYRIDKSATGDEHLGWFHQYPPTPVTDPKGKRSTAASEAFRTEQKKMYPDSDFFEVEITF